jgi:hypothetical protein
MPASRATKPASSASLRRCSVRASTIGAFPWLRA